MAEKPKTPSSADLTHTLKRLEGLFSQTLQNDPRAKETVNTLLSLLKDKYGVK